MRSLTVSDVHQVSGGMICSQAAGFCLFVSRQGVPDQYYSILDNAYELWFNDLINDNQFEQKLAKVPLDCRLSYENNLEQALLNKLLLSELGKF